MSHIANIEAILSSALSLKHVANMKKDHEPKEEAGTLEAAKETRRSSCVTWTAVGGAVLLTCHSGSSGPRGRYACFLMSWFGSEGCCGNDIPPQRGKQKRNSSQTRLPVAGDRCEHPGWSQALASQVETWTIIVTLSTLLTMAPENAEATLLNIEEQLRLASN